MIRLNTFRALFTIIFGRSAFLVVMAEELSPWEDSSNHSDTSDDECSDDNSNQDYFPFAFRRTRAIKLDPKKLNTKQKLWLGYNSSKDAIT